MSKFKISFALVDDNKMKELNEKYRDQEGVTDVLSFEIKEATEDGIFLLGEVVVDKEKAEEQAKEIGKEVEEEVADLIRHGVLHLLGKHHD
ncbi:MAG: rRNA maturation RNase YbeY [Patescibacteria group bacterium]|nr:rRNA maturation RNase YbeY [Patescibacteria group bacterium]